MATINAEIHHPYRTIYWEFAFSLAPTVWAPIETWSSKQAGTPPIYVSGQGTSAIEIDESKITTADAAKIRFRTATPGADPIGGTHDGVTVVQSEESLVSVGTLSWTTDLVPETVTLATSPVPETGAFTAVTTAQTETLTWEWRPTASTVGDYLPLDIAATPDFTTSVADGYMQTDSKLNVLWANDAYNGFVRCKADDGQGEVSYSNEATLTVINGVAGDPPPLIFAETGAFKAVTTAQTEVLTWEWRPLAGDVGDYLPLDIDATPNFTTEIAVGYTQSDSQLNVLWANDAYSGFVRCKAVGGETSYSAEVSLTIVNGAAGSPPPLIGA